MAVTDRWPRTWGREAGAISLFFFFPLCFLTQIRSGAASPICCTPSIAAGHVEISCGLTFLSFFFFSFHFSRFPGRRRQERGASRVGLFERAPGSLTGKKQKAAPGRPGPSFFFFFSFPPDECVGRHDRAPRFPRHPRLFLERRSGAHRHPFFFFSPPLYLPKINRRQDFSFEGRFPVGSGPGAGRNAPVLFSFFFLFLFFFAAREAEQCRSLGDALLAVSSLMNMSRKCVKFTFFFFSPHPLPSRGRCGPRHSRFPDPGNLGRDAAPFFPPSLRGDNNGAHAGRG